MSGVIPTLEDTSHRRTKYVRVKVRALVPPAIAAAAALTLWGVSRFAEKAELPPEGAVTVTTAIAAPLPTTVFPSLPATFGPAPEFMEPPAAVVAASKKTTGQVSSLPSWARTRLDQLRTENTRLAAEVRAIEIERQRHEAEAEARRKEADAKEARDREVNRVRYAISGLVLCASLYGIFGSKKQEDTKRWSFATAGTVLGYWLK